MQKCFDVINMYWEEPQKCLALLQTIKMTLVGWMLTPPLTPGKIQHLSFKAIAFGDIPVNISIFCKSVEHTAPFSSQLGVSGPPLYHVFNQSSSLSKVSNNNLEWILN